MDNQIKPGEQVSLIVDQKNTDGQVIMHSKTVWAGFDNANANAFTINFFRTLLDYTGNLSQTKNA